MPLEPVSAAVLSAFKIGCVVTAWNNYNLNFLSISYGFDKPVNEFIISTLPSPGESAAAFLEVNGYVGYAAMADLAFSAASHASNIAQFNSALAAADQCGIMTANSEWAPVVTQLAVASSTAAKGLVARKNAGIDEPVPNLAYSAAQPGSARDDSLFSDNECGVLFFGDAGDDEIFSTTCDDIILGGIGNDKIRLTGGNNFLVGGQDDDTYYLTSGSHDVIADFGITEDYDVLVIDSPLAGATLHTLSDSPTDLVITYDDSDATTLVVGTIGERGPNTVEEIRFSDGRTVLTHGLDETLPSMNRAEIADQETQQMWLINIDQRASSAETTTGQKLKIKLDQPGAGTELKRDLRVSGTVVVGSQLNARSSVLYVVDLSRSTEMAGNDCNGDGFVNDADDVARNDPGVGTVLDCELAAVQSFNHSLGNNPDVDVAVLGFETGVLSSYSSDFVSPPNADTDGDSIADISAFVRDLSRTPLLGWGGTNFSTALTRARSMLRGQRNAQNQIYFFTDGISSIDAIPEAEVLAREGTVVNTFSIGQDAEGCSDTQIGRIASTTGGFCQQVDTPSVLAGVISDVVLSPPANIASMSIAVNGAEPTILSVDAIGQWSAFVSEDQLNAATNTIRVSATSSDQTVAAVVITANVSGSDPVSPPISPDVPSNPLLPNDTTEPPQSSGGGGGLAIGLLLTLMANAFLRWRARSVRAGA